MTTFTPIETRYAGCRFRSRLEARWAVFFDAMNIPWEYEPQGYTLSNGRNYLPDFLLPECGTWIEVKGSAAQLDTTLMEQAALDLPTMPSKPGCEQGPKLMILGPPPPPQDDGIDYGWSSAVVREESYIADDPVVTALREKVRQRSHTTEVMLVGAAVLSIEDGTLTLVHKSAALANRLCYPHHADIIREAIMDVFSADWQFTCAVAEASYRWRMGHKTRVEVDWETYGFGYYYKNHRPWYLSCGGGQDWVSPGIAEDGSDDSRNGYAAMRSARFEHGEQGPPTPAIDSTPAQRGVPLRLRPGDLVHHHKYGHGCVEEVRGDHESALSVIDFGGKRGRVLLMHNHAPMKKVV